MNIKNAYLYLYYHLNNFIFSLVVYLMTNWRYIFLNPQHYLNAFITCLTVHIMINADIFLDAVLAAGAGIALLIAINFAIDRTPE